MRNRIIGALKISSDSNARRAANEIEQQFVFVHPTIQGLATAVASLVDPSSAIVQGKAHIGDLIAKYSADFPTARFSDKSVATSDFVVLLTGSTGSLGAHILASLLEEPKVAKVFTLNRGDNVAERQQQSFVDKNLPTDLLSSKKLVQLSADLSRDDLGLDSKVLDEVRIHCLFQKTSNISQTARN